MTPTVKTNNCHNNMKNKHKYHSSKLQSENRMRIFLLPRDSWNGRVVNPTRGASN